MIDGRSNLLASELGDIFARLGWHRAGFAAMATESATAVAVQYRSPKFGAVRVVSCDALGVARWLKTHAVKPGGKAKFEELLDRKESVAAAPVQQLLNLTEPVARRAMRPSGGVS